MQNQLKYITTNETADKILSKYKTHCAESLFGEIVFGVPTKDAQFIKKYRIESYYNIITMEEKRYLIYDKIPIFQNTLKKIDNFVLNKNIFK